MAIATSIAALKWLPAFLQPSSETKKAPSSVKLSRKDRATVRFFFDKKVHFVNLVPTQLWGCMMYGPKVEVRDERDKPYWRSYAQVDYSQIPRALEVIDKMAQARAKQGKTTLFKFIASNTTSKKYKGQQALLSSIGIYGKADPAQPMIVFYGDKQAEVLEVLEELSMMPEWREVEIAQGGKAHGLRAHFFYEDGFGRKFNTLMYNCYKGQPLYNGLPKELS